MGPDTDAGVPTPSSCNARGLACTSMASALVACCLVARFPGCVFQSRGDIGCCFGPVAAVEL
eukprot:m.353539 g.353539  ORF g.353539 m.353539 type:complete len:62 (+) comp19906_c3_seq3:630-815(+)